MPRAIVLANSYRSGYTGRYVTAKARNAGIKALSYLQRRWRGKKMLYRKRASRAISNYRRSGYYQTKYGRRLKTQPAVQKSQALGVIPMASNQLTLIPLGNLVFRALDWPAGNNNSIVMRQRASSDILLKGIRFVRSFEFLRGGTEFIPPCPPIMMHWALIQFKNANVDTANYDAEIRKDFFRVFYEGNDREDPFPNNSSSSNWTTLLNTAKMNPDGNFNIITHRKRIMQQGPAFPPGGDGWNLKARDYIWQFDRYIKFNKRVDWSNSFGSRPTNDIVEVFWCQTLTPKDYPVIADSVVAQTWHQHTMYYADRGSA